MLTSQDVRAIHFSMPLVGHRGYDARQVDAFLERVASTLDGYDTVTADEVRAVLFGAPRFGARGYQGDQVDEFLDRVRVELQHRQRGDRPAPAPRGATPQPSLLGLDDVLATSFPRAETNGQGFHEEEVDAFLDLVAATLSGPGSLTLDDLHAVHFTDARPGTKGYQRIEVQAFLDLVAAALEQAARRN